MQEMAKRYNLRLLESRFAALEAILSIYYEWRGNRDKLPDIAIVAPTFTQVLVLPSRGPALVTRMLRSSRSGDMNIRLVRMVRTHSAAVLFGFSST